MSKRVKSMFTERAIIAAFVAESIAKHAKKKDIGAHSIFLGQVPAHSIEGKTWELSQRIKSKNHYYLFKIENVEGYKQAP